MTVIDEWVADYDGRAREMLDEMLVLLRSLMPAAGVEETISYGVPTFKLNGKNLVHFGAAAKHVSLYPGAAGVEHVADVLHDQGIKSSKGTIQFDLKRPLPTDLIEGLVGWLIAKQS